MSHWDLLLTNARIATMQRGASEFGVIDNGAVAVSGGDIAWVGDASGLPDIQASESRS